MPVPFWLKKLLVRTGTAQFLPAAKRLADGDTDSLRYYSDRVLGAPIAGLLDPATFPAAGAGVINLDQAAPSFDSPVSGGRLAADRQGNPHPWGQPALRTAVADLYRRRDGRTLDPTRDVLITHGATGAYAAVLDAFVNPGNKVVLFDPCSPLFALGAKSRRAAVRWVPTRTEDGKLKFEADVFARAMRGAKLLVVSDPGNPTGATLGEEELGQIAWAANRSDALIYLDESFSRVRYEGDPCPLATLPGADRRTLSAGSLTQGYGLGSARVGWLTGPHRLIRACTLTANLSAPYVPTICQQIALRAVQAEEELFGPVLEEFRARRKYAFERLKTLGFTPTWPAGGFFFWVSVAELGFDGRTFAERLQKEQGVLVGPGCAFGPSGGSFVRISFAAEDGRLREGLGRLATFIEGLKEKTAVEPRTKPAPTDGAAVETEVGEEKEKAPPAFSRV
ncbi:pyridoxal phosphate-dependent aminotransferase [Fimbriiglobus ruber]|uniref:Glutamine-dependent 2-keto-4-methylthiobutyrate transaminase n=1 Tax=Fimbriiglobus ruber TaxID=1908690 RepID=A0A225DZN5_9BACT|nr:pyridoxal phosphate-dependent aminotransferase [Fimbriiglobus ruber]OWK46762.1 Glutamine-dependent 2-keto-4-methylthiobutyrate transaminase [Fimbriiglobus ruber]